jgi:hypothetical protein
MFPARLSAAGGKTPDHIVVLRSTVMPGNARDVVLPWLGAGAGNLADPHLSTAHNLEFLREGKLSGTSNIRRER